MPPVGGASLLTLAEHIVRDLAEGKRRRVQILEIIKGGDRYLTMEEITENRAYLRKAMIIPAVGQNHL